MVGGLWRKQVRKGGAKGKCLLATERGGVGGKREHKRRKALTTSRGDKGERGIEAQDGGKSWGKIACKGGGKGRFFKG